MHSGKKNYWFLIVNIALFAVIIILRDSGIMTLKLYSATPLLHLALLVAVCMFCSELKAFLCGLILGMFADSVSMGAPGFNTIVLLLIALFAALTAKYLFNNNVRACIALCFICTTFYFLVKWLIEYAFVKSTQNNATYLLEFAIPCIFYTTVFAAPFYYLERWLHSKKS